MLCVYTYICMCIYIYLTIWLISVCLNAMKPSRSVPAFSVKPSQNGGGCNCGKQTSMWMNVGWTGVYQVWYIMALVCSCCLSCVLPPVVNTVTWLFAIWEASVSLCNSKCWTLGALQSKKSTSSWLPPQRSECVFDLCFSHWKVTCQSSKRIPLSFPNWSWSPH